MAQPLVLQGFGLPLSAFWYPFSELIVLLWGFPCLPGAVRCAHSSIRYRLERIMTAWREVWKFKVRYLW